MKIEKRVLIFSDAHEYNSYIYKALIKHEDAKTVLFLGDGVDCVTELEEAFKAHEFICVKGNCDWYSTLCNDLPDTRLLEICGKRIFMCHGHTFNVKYELKSVKHAARAAKADVLLFGHTHTPLVDYEKDLHIINPGSCGRFGASYAVLDIGEECVANIIRF